MKLADLDDDEANCDGCGWAFDEVQDVHKTERMDPSNAHQPVTVCLCDLCFNCITGYYSMGQPPNRTEVCLMMNMILKELRR